MKTSLFTLAAIVIGTASSVAIAAPQGKTRAEVRAELKALQDVGYTASSDHTHYPANLQMAQAKLNKQRMREMEMGRPQHSDAMSAPAAKMKRTGNHSTYLFDQTYRGQ
ncbi:DUF4148 domain-containing protein [Pandoraea sp. NPDC087047]|uniref:DUF4148 domain-containing protein n=1 Tax=Pandoraea sp. NPDC087047 TaxID=3364390 RepID=UPI0038146D27